jgi:signal transduction histidine kinase
MAGSGRSGVSRPTDPDAAAYIVRLRSTPASGWSNVGMWSPGRAWRAHADDRGLRAAAIDATAVGLVGLLAVVLRIDPPLEPGGLAAASAEVPWLRLLTLVPALLLMLAKHRAPVAALVAGTVVLAVDQALGGSLGVLLAFFDLLYNATQRVSRPALRVLGRLVTGAVVLTGVVTAVVTRDPRTTFLALLVAAAVLGTPCWWGLSVRQQRELAEAADERAQAAGLLAALEHERRLQEERTRTARDLHDALAGNLAAISMNAEVGANATAARPGSLEHRTLTAIRSTGVAALQEMRAMIDVLHDPDGDPGRTAPARLEHLDETLAGARATGREVDVLLDGVPAPGSLRERPELVDLPAAVAQAAHRITSEALTNAIRHGTGPVTLCLDRLPHALALRVVNRTGSGAELTGTYGGVGLPSMRERAHALGGTLRSGRRGDDAWELVAHLPLSQEGEA